MLFLRHQQPVIPFFKGIEDLSASYVIPSFVIAIYEGECHIIEERSVRAIFILTRLVKDGLEFPGRSLYIKPHLDLTSQEG